MRASFWHFLTGGLRYRLAREAVAPVLNAFRCAGLYYRDLRDTGEGAELTVSLRCGKKATALLASAGAAYTEEWLGLPAILRRYRHRIGLPIGAAFLCFLVAVSSRFIWCFEIKGNQRVSDGEIIAGLTELGCGLGARIRSLSMDAIENEFVLRSDNTCWISVNIKGTTARVEVRELLTGETADHRGKCANVVAREPGEVVYVDVTEGRHAVVAGDTVKAGELLISGILASKSGEVRYEYAAGEVMARVTRVIRVEILPHTEEKIYTGRETVRKSVIIFGKSINLFGNSGKSTASCDMIETSENFSFFREANLPLSVTSCLYREYEIREKEVSESDAVAAGLSELRRQMDAALEDAELLEKTVSAGFVDGVYTLECRLYVLTNIAETREVPLTENGELYGTEGDQRS